MHIVAFVCLVLALMVSVFGGLAASRTFLSGEGGDSVRWLRSAQWILTGLVFISCAVLFQALVLRDFSIEYVHDYTDGFLPIFYVVTAFWAGQDGSFLFWLAMTALMGGIIAWKSPLDQASQRINAAFWIFFFLAQSMFLLLLTGPSNPFVRLSPAPLEGNGLNPLLQNPGMIFHPPLLFIGYAGLTVPCCMALAYALGGRPGEWIAAARNWLLTAWTFLTAGIVLGAWWSYMELGWGGYWAWDPVENASLIPWLAATALVHTALIGRNGKSLVRTNVFLAGLSFLLCIFATFVVRSGFIDSLHAFGSGGVGFPLLGAMIIFLFLLAGTTWAASPMQVRPVGDFAGRQGLMLVAAWLFLALGTMITLGVLWPVLSTLWSDNPVGLDADFYNRVCLPPFVLISLLLVICPWFSWKKGFLSRRGAAASVLVFFLSAGLLWVLGITRPLALAAGASALALVFSALAVVFVSRPVRKSRRSLGAMGVHFGLGLMVLGIAVSGPYKIEREFIVAKAESIKIGSFEILYQGFDERETEAMFVAEAELKVTKDGEHIGLLKPQKRMYRNFEQTFAEVSVIPSLGEEVYATLLAFDQDRNISIKVSINPLVNWIWIGGTIMCLAAFAALRFRSRNTTDFES